MLGAKVKADYFRRRNHSPEHQARHTKRKKVKVPGKGFRDRKGNVGDLLVNIMVVIPENPGEKEISLYKELAQLHEA